MERGEIGEALEYLQISLTAAERLKNETVKFLPLVRLAQIYAELGLVEPGFDAFKRLAALNLGSQLPERLHELISAHEANLHLAKNDLNAAQKAMENVHPQVAQMTVFPFIDHTMGLVACAVSTAGEDYPRVLHLTDEYIAGCESAGMRFGLGDLYYWRGLALHATKEPEAARASFLSARAIAEETGARRILWKILTALAQMEAQAGAIKEAETLQGQAAEIIHYIADHAGSEEGRSSFLSRAEVRKALN